MQDVSPTPPLIYIPRWTTSVQWRALLSGALVAREIRPQTTSGIRRPQLRRHRPARLQRDQAIWARHHARRSPRASPRRATCRRSAHLPCPRIRRCAARARRGTPRTIFPPRSTPTKPTSWWIAFDGDAVSFPTRPSVYQQDGLAAFSKMNPMRRRGRRRPVQGISPDCTGTRPIFPKTRSIRTVLATARSLDGDA